jgi:thiazole synthase ThiGH ThiG subunit
MTYSLEADPLVLGGKKFRSRLLVGTGKYQTLALMKEALEASDAEIVTVAVRRVNLDRSKESLLDYIQPDVIPPRMLFELPVWVGKRGCPSG